MEFLSNPVYLGLVIGALGLLVPVVIYLKQRSKKEVSYHVYDSISLINIKEEVKENFEVSYRGIPVQDATLLSVRVWNSGNIPIEEADFIDPIKLDFGKVTTVIFYCVASDPDNILGQYKDLGGEGYITFIPRLFNKGYEITVTVMVTGFSGHVKAEGLIKGVHSIRNVKFPLNTSFSWKIPFIGSLDACLSRLLIAVLCISIYFGQKPINPSYIFLSICCFPLISVFTSSPI